MREALEEMAGEESGTSAQMLQMIRENLEEALTGEYAEELKGGPPQGRGGGRPSASSRTS